MKNCDVWNGEAWREDLTSKAEKAYTFYGKRRHTLSMEREGIHFLWKEKAYTFYGKRRVTGKWKVQREGKGRETFRMKWKFDGNNISELEFSSQLKSLPLSPSFSHFSIPVWHQVVTIWSLYILRKWVSRECELKWYETWGWKVWRNWEEKKENFPLKSERIFSWKERRFKGSRNRDFDSRDWLTRTALWEFSSLPFLLLRPKNSFDSFESVLSKT